MNGFAGNLHATAIALGPMGFLIEGPSGCGKTSLALAAIDQMRSQNQFAVLVADDQCVLETANGKLIANCPPALTGLVEMRGLGVVHHPNLLAVVINCVIRLIEPENVVRMPDQKFAMIAGLKLPVFELPQRQIAVSAPILMQIVKDRRF
jgi:serine kinase of HPr protein (carbohydrate metabolism regulator)